MNGVESHDSRRQIIHSLPALVAPHISICHLPSCLGQQPPLKSRRMQGSQRTRSTDECHVLFNAPIPGDLLYYLGWQVSNGLVGSA